MKTTNVIALLVLSSLIQLIPVNCDVQHLLEEVYELDTNNDNGVEKSEKLLKEIMKEQLALARLQAKVEKHLKANNTEKNENVSRSADISSSDQKLRETVFEIAKLYDKQLIDNIITQTVDGLIKTRNLTKIPDLFWSLYRENESELFDIMLRLYIQLYNSFSVGHHSDEKQFLQNYAYGLYKIKNEHFYTSANMSLKANVNSIEKKLPENLKNLYFASYFCLLNVKFNNYIYTAIQLKVDPVSRYIWLWYDNESMDDTGYIKANVSEFNTPNEKKFKVSLMSTKYKLYYYMMPETHIIAGWDSVGAPLNHIWDLEFLDNDRVVFSQNDYLMCGIELYDDERRNIGGRKKDEVSSTSPECQWRLGECSFE